MRPRRTSIEFSCRFASFLFPLPYSTRVVAFLSIFGNYYLWRAIVHDWSIRSRVRKRSILIRGFSFVTIPREKKIRIICLSYYCSPSAKEFKIKSVGSIDVGAICYVLMGAYVINQKYYYGNFPRPTWRGKFGANNTSSKVETFTSLSRLVEFSRVFSTRVESLLK